MIGVYATGEVKTEYKAEFEVLVKKFIAESLTHKGVVSYDCGEIDGKPNHYCFIERWQTKADLDAHLDSSFFQTHAPALVGYLVNGLEINTLTLL